MNVATVIVALIAGCVLGGVVAVGSLKSRVLVSARKFRELETTGTDQEIDPALPVETAPRELQASEMA